MHNLNKCNISHSILFITIGSQELHTTIPIKKQGKIFDVMASDEEELLNSSLAAEVIKLKSSRDSIIEKCVTDLYCTSSDVSYLNYINDFPSTIKNAFKYIT